MAHLRQYREDKDGYERDSRLETRQIITCAGDLEIDVAHGEQNKEYQKYPAKAYPAPITPNHNE